MKFKLLLFIILSSVGFFNPHGILSTQVCRLLFMMSTLAALCYGMLNGVSLHEVKYPRVPLIVLLVSIFTGSLMAYFFHGQSITVCITTSLTYILGYSCFYIFLKLDLPSEKIMNAYLVLCCISAVVYFCNVLTFPNNMFGEPILGEDITRGILRVPVVFIEFFPMIVFYGINRWILEKKKLWLVVIAFASLMIILSVIRQIIALTALLALFFLFKNVSWKIKAAMSVAVIGVVVYVLPMIPMYNAMLELSEEQQEENEDEEDIRIQSWRFYTYENQTNSLTPIFGNGVPIPKKSRWGNEFDSETTLAGLYATDVGWAGFFFYFGLIATAALLTLLLKATFKRKAPEQQYLTYWLIFIMITSIASGPILYYWQIIDISICLYLVYTHNYKTYAPTESPIQDDISNHSLDNSELQQLPGYPQLHSVNSSVQYRSHKDNIG